MYFSVSDTIKVVMLNQFEHRMLPWYRMLSKTNVPNYVFSGSYFPLYGPNTGKCGAEKTSQNYDQKRKLFRTNSFVLIVRHISLTLSWRRPLSYRNQSIDFQSRSMDWFLYDNGLHHERVNDFWNLTQHGRK